MTVGTFVMNMSACFFLLKKVVTCCTKQDGGAVVTHCDLNNCSSVCSSCTGITC